MVEIGTEMAARDRLAQIPVGGSDDSRAAEARAGLADPVEFAVLEHAEQLRLQFERQLADLVEEQGAGLGFLEIAGVAFGGAGKCAARVTKQLRLDQRRCDRGAIECQVGLVAAHTDPMEVVANEFLAGAGFALDQQRERAVRELGNLSAQLRDRGAAAVQAGRFFGTAGPSCRRVHQQRRAEQSAEVIRINRLCQIFECAEGTGMTCVCQFALTGQNDDPHLRCMGQQIGYQCETFIGPVRRRRQAEVHQRQRRRLGQCPDATDRAGACVGGDDSKILLQNVAEGLRDQRIIVYYQQLRPRVGGIDRRAAAAGSVAGHRASLVDPAGACFETRLRRPALTLQCNIAILRL